MLIFPSNLKAIFAGCRVLGWEFPTFSICWSPLSPWEVICHSHYCSVIVFGSWAGFELVVDLMHLAGPWDPSTWRVRSVFAFHSGLQLLALLNNDCLWPCGRWTDEPGESFVAASFRFSLLLALCVSEVILGCYLQEGSGTMHCTLWNLVTLRPWVCLNVSLWDYKTANNME